MQLRRGISRKNATGANNTKYRLKILLRNSQELRVTADSRQQIRGINRAFGLFWTDRIGVGRLAGGRAVNRTLSRALEKQPLGFGFLWIDRQACVLSILDLERDSLEKEKRPICRPNRAFSIL
jgi:hypothetical protein